MTPDEITHLENLVRNNRVHEIKQFIFSDSQFSIEKLDQLFLICQSNKKIDIFNELFIELIKQIPDLELVLQKKCTSLSVN